MTVSDEWYLECQLLALLLYPCQGGTSWHIVRFYRSTWESMLVPSRN